MSTKDDGFEQSNLNDPAEQQEHISRGEMLKMIGDHFEANKDEITRAQTELPVNKPSEVSLGAYVQLKEIMGQGYKTPEWDEKGYCIPRPVLNSDTKLLEFRLYALVSSKHFIAASSLYSRYIDEPMILFREYDRKPILCLLKEGYSIAVKGSGLEGFYIKPEYKNVFDIEYIYLMIRHEKFGQQFPMGMNARSLLNGWIPRMDYNKQKNAVNACREKSCNELREGLEILS